MDGCSYLFWFFVYLPVHNVFHFHIVYCTFINCYYYWQICSLTLDILLQHIINDRIDVFINILEQEWESILDSQLQLLQEVRIVEGANLHGEKIKQK